MLIIISTINLKVENGGEGLETWVLAELHYIIILLAPHFKKNLKFVLLLMTHYKIWDKNIIKRNSMRLVQYILLTNSLKKYIKFGWFLEQGHYFCRAIFCGPNYIGTRHINNINFKYYKKFNRCYIISFPKSSMFNFFCFNWIFFLS